MKDASPNERRVASAAAWVLIGCVFALIWPTAFGGATAYIGIDGESMSGTFESGDLVIVREQRSYEVGDAVTFRVPAGEFGAGAHVIHRIIGGNGTDGFTLQGDNKTQADPWRPTAADIVGKSWIHIPGGAARFKQMGQPVPLGALCAGLTVFAMLLPRKDEVTEPATA